MHGGSKPLHLPLGGKDITPLPPPPAHRTLRVDGCRHDRTRRNKSHTGNKPCPGRTKHWRTNVVIHRGNSPSCKRSPRRRMRNERTQMPYPETSVLRVHGPHSMQVLVPTLPKNSIHSLHGIPEAMTLLSRVFYNSSLGSTTQRYYKQP